MTTPAPVSGPTNTFAPTGIGAGQENTLQNVANQSQSALKSSLAKQGAYVTEDFNPLSYPFEWAGAKMYQIYSNYVSRPISTALIMPNILTANGQGAFTSGGMFDKENWDRAWADAAHVSPGQAVYKNLGTMLDTESQYNKSMGYNPKDGTIIWDHPDQVQSFFNHGSQKWISGGTDAAFSWYADPTVLLGRVGGVAKDLTYLKAGEKVTNQTLKGAVTSAAIGVAGKVVKSSPEQINVAQATWDARRFNQSGMVKNLAGEGVQNSVFTKLGDNIAKNKISQGDNFSAWATKRGWGALASALTQARTRQDIDDVLAVAMGDNERAVSATNRSAATSLNVGATAQAAGRAVPSTLPKYNAELGVQLQELQQQKNILYSQVPGETANAAAMRQIQRTMITDHMQKIQDEVSFMDKLVGSHAYDVTSDMKNPTTNYLGGGITPSMKASGIRYNTVISPLASKASTWAEGVDYRALRGVSASKFAANLAYNNGFVRPVRLFSGQAWGDLRPNGYIKVDDPNSHLEVGAQLKNSKLFSQDEQGSMLSQYINATPAERPDVLKGMEAEMTQKIASKYGISPEGADMLYNHFNNARGAATNRMYSTAKITDKAGNSYYADQVLSSDGSMVTTHPILSSQLANQHVMMDYDFMNRVMKYNSRAFRNLVDNAAMTNEAALARVTRTTAPGALTTRALGLSSAATDVLNALWKTNVIFRLGYGVRALSDDFMGQIARFGAANMALRMTNGSQVGITKLNSWMHDPLGWDQKFAQSETNMKASQWIIDDLQDQHDAHKAIVYKAPSALRRQDDRLTQYKNQIDIEKQGLEDLKLTHAGLLQTRSRMVDKPVILPSGQVVDAFANGPEGAMALNLNAGGRYAYDTGVGTAANALLGHIRGSDEGSWAAIRRGDSGYNEAWYRGVQMEIANDPLAKQFLAGASVKDALKWMQKPEGNAHFNSLKLRNMQKSDLAESVQAHVNHMLPVTDSSTAAVRAAVASGENDQKVKTLMKAVPAEHQPLDVPGAAQRSYAMGKGSANRLLDSGISHFYKWMAEQPTQVLSRNPLVAELYNNHTMSAYKAAEAQGFTHLDQGQLDRIAKQSRSMAIDDVKRFTYNMDHETKLAYMTRFMMPFFGPMQEPINRWARIALDRPESLGRFELLYNAPARVGMETDINGNALDGAGYADDPAKPGSKRIVPIDERVLSFTPPDWMAKALGANGGKFKDGAGNTYTIKPALQMRIGSLPLPFRNDPWYNPGEGPWVQMAANEVAKAHPSLGDTMQNLGILPTGVKKSDIDILGGQLQRSVQPQDPKTAAQMALMIMADENYKYQNGLRKTAPTLSEVEKKAAHEAALNSWLSGSLTGAGATKDLLGAPFHLLMPVNMKITDNYQFFRDAYQNMAAANPQTARQLFYQKYGASAYGFTQSIMQDKYSGVPTTLKGLAGEQKYASLLDKYPDMAGVILGSDANGTYSPTANTLMQMRGDKTAMTPEAAWKESQVSLGWQKYQLLMNYVTSQLKLRGATKLGDPGTEDLQHLKSAWVASQTSATLPDGVTPNPSENKDWAAAYYGNDPYAADDKANELTSILGTDPKLAKRKDMQGLASYLEARNVATATMAQRRVDSGSTATGPLDINSKANADIKNWFQGYVLGVVEGNTDFQSLHDRYLANDMFDHYDGTVLTNSVYGED